MSVYLKSLEDLHLPDGLIPENCTFYVERIAKVALQNLENVSLEEINDILGKLYKVYKHSINALRNKDVKDAIETTATTLKRDGENLSDLVDEFGKDIFFLQFVNILEIEKYSALEGDITGDEERMSQVDKSKQYHAINALYFYLLAINKAKRLADYDWPHNNAFYRYGRVANYLLFADKVLSISSGINREINVLNTREAGIAAAKKAAGSKGGKTRVSKYEPLKKVVFKLYDESYSHMSNRRAANHILDELCDDPLMDVITAECPEETIEKWIGAYVKSRRQG